MSNPWKQQADANKNKAPPAWMNQKPAGTGGPPKPPTNNPPPAQPWAKNNQTQPQKPSQPPQGFKPPTTQNQPPKPFVPPTSTNPSGGWRPGGPPAGNTSGSQGNVPAWKNNSANISKSSDQQSEKQ